MSSTFTSLWQRFQTFPRAIQWLGYTLAGVVAFIIVNDYIWELGRIWSEKAETIERQVTDAGDIAGREFDAKSLQSAIVALGPVEMPTDLASSQKALTRVAADVLAKYRSVADDRFDPKGAATMPAVLSRILPGKKIERISGEVRFDSSVEDAIAIIADFESRPEIEAVTTVRMIRQPAIKKLRVNLTIDAWVVTDAAAKRGVANSA